MFRTFAAQGMDLKGRQAAGEDAQGWLVRAKPISADVDIDPSSSAHVRVPMAKHGSERTVCPNCYLLLPMSGQCDTCS
jgi:hypothetical protein